MDIFGPETEKDSIKMQRSKLELVKALERRFKIIHIDTPYQLELKRCNAIDVEE